MKAYREGVMAALLLAAALPARAAGPKQTTIAPAALPAISVQAPAGLAPIALPDFHAELVGHLSDLQGRHPFDAVQSLQKAALASPQSAAAQTAAAQAVLKAVASPSFTRVKPGSQAEGLMRSLIGEQAYSDLQHEASRIQEAALEHEPLAGTLSGVRGLLLPQSRAGRESWAEEAVNLGKLFDNSGQAHEVQDPDFSERDEPAAGDRSLDPADELRLLSLSSLGPEELEAFAAKLEGFRPADDAELPLPPDTTFSLELEFLVNRQLTEPLLDALLTGEDALTDAERSQWRASKKLPYKKWDKVQGEVVERVESVLPKGWRLTHESMNLVGNTLEIKTANDGGVLHYNTVGDWKDLARSLRLLQESLPGGLFSVHLHASRRSELLRQRSAKRDWLSAHSGRAARVILMFEPYWRALYRVAWPDPRKLREWGLEDPYDALAPNSAGRAETVAKTHGLFANLSTTHPTVEVRLLSGLIDGTGPNGRHLDADRLKEDLWPAFALTRLILDAGKPLPLVSLPLPQFDGTLSAAGMVRFLDLAYAEDALGKVVALRKLRAWKNAGGTAPAPDADRRQAGLQMAYRQAGLEVVYRLHRKHGGYDSKLLTHLQADDGYLLKRLAEDLSTTGLDRAELVALFPEAMADTVLEAVASVRRQRAGAP